MKQKINGHNVHRETHKQGLCKRRTTETVTVEKDGIQGSVDHTVSTCHLDLPENQPAKSREKNTVFRFDQRKLQLTKRRKKNRIKDKMQKESRRRNRAAK